MTIPKWPHSSLSSHFLPKYDPSKLTRFLHFSTFWLICIEIWILNKINDFRPVSGQIFLKMIINIHSRNCCEWTTPISLADTKIYCYSALLINYIKTYNSLSIYWSIHCESSKYFVLFIILTTFSQYHPPELSRGPSQQWPPFPHHPIKVTYF